MMFQAQLGAKKKNECPFIVSCNSKEILVFALQLGSNMRPFPGDRTARRNRIIYRVFIDIYN
jgi:hypothetical protein